MTLYNVVFTSLTPGVIGIFDRDVDREMGLRFPTLYKQGARCRAILLNGPGGAVANLRRC